MPPTIAARHPRTGVLACAAFVVLVAAFWVVARQFGIAEKLGPAGPLAALSFALLLAPYWAFGFGFGDWLRPRLRSRAARVLTPASLVIAYLAFVAGRGGFRWSMALWLAGIPVLVAALLDTAPDDAPHWHDWAALLVLALAVELPLLKDAWPAPGLTGLPKLLIVDAGLYGYLVVRRIGGIGFDFRPRGIDFKVGLREFVLYTPVALALGFLMGFLHFHRTWADPLWFGSGWLFTLFFIAVPEELFFRGLLLNMLERRIGARRALWITSAVFGLAHFSKRAAYFNWRYVILAAIAGVFYGRAWLARRRVLTSSVTHATVDTVWSIWLR